MKPPPLLIFSAACFMVVSGCTSGSLIPTGPKPTQPEAQSTQAISNETMTNLIGEILKSPQDYIGKSVEVIGYFHGWDLLNEVDQSPPVTRSDWVIADNSGAIYVTGSMPGSLDPSSQDSLMTLIRLSAVVSQKNGEVYLEASSADVIQGK